MCIDARPGGFRSLGRSGRVPVVLCGVVLLVVLCSPTAGADERPLGLTTFLDRMMSVDHLPEPVAGHTRMTSTWDRTGRNGDGRDFKQIEGDRNVLLDVDGPGCVHRIFTGRLGKEVEGTRIRVYLDGGAKPVFDMPVNEFLDDKNGPFPYPLVFHKTYPGMLFPMPFAKHCRIELYNPAMNHWGNYWQVTYTQYAKNTPVETLTWPLSDAEKKTLERLCQTWLRAESAPPETPKQWTIRETITLAPKRWYQFTSHGGGVIRQLRVHASPSTPEVLSKVKLQCFWDGGKSPAVDMPIGYFFGNVATGYKDQYHSLLMGVDQEYAYCRFPMPFADGAVVRFENDSADKVTLKLQIDVERSEPDAVRPGRFRASLLETEVEEAWANRDRLPRFGAKKQPVHTVLDVEKKRGKYVGVFLHVDWPSKPWWGEGDWLIWADEDGWPPAYHGTGSEEYFNSGWCKFDQKAVSGIIREPVMRPGHVGVYSFHLNDAFSFENRLRVAVEICTWLGSGSKMPHSFWRSTAYWYEFPAAQ
ncbi:MAG: DUF2961 domain-containing protein [Pirellulales bacterium]|nr:DUF2961 domain-containing protein [Pirellulales bacterium]